MKGLRAGTLVLVAVGASGVGEGPKVGVSVRVGVLVRVCVDVGVGVGVRVPVGLGVEVGVPGCGWGWAVVSGNHLRPGIALRYSMLYLQISAPHILLEAIPRDLDSNLRTRIHLSRHPKAHFHKRQALFPGTIMHSIESHPPYCRS